MVGSTPSRSLDDDMKEAATTRYHRTVTKTQLAEHKRLYEEAEILCSAANNLIQKNPNRKKEIICDANKQLDQIKADRKARIDNVIIEERVKLELLLSNISLWMNRDTKTG